VAVINLPVPATPLVLVVANWLPLVGSDMVTVGIVGPAAAVHTAPGMIVPDDRVKPAPSIGSRPSPPPPHPAAKAVSRQGINHISRLE
jgi:hypothetical protein